MSELSASDMLKAIPSELTVGETIENALQTFGEGDALFEGEPTRDDGGKFAKAAAEPEPGNEAAKKPDTDRDDPESKATETATDEAEDYIEIPGEGDGAQPERLKLQDVLEGYKERQKLRVDLEELSRKAATIPDHVEKALVDATRARQQYAAGLEQLQRWMKPQWPDPTLANPNHPSFNPEAYSQQYEAAARLQDLQNRTRQEQERVEKESKEVDAAVRASRHQREWAEAIKVWPELKDQSTQRELVAWLKTLGYADTDLDQVSSRDLNIIKRAMAYDKSQVAKETAAKVVLAKPKVVRPQARGTPQTGREAAASAAMARLAKSGSADDAIAAIEALL